MKLIEFSRNEYLNMLRRQMGAEQPGSFVRAKTVQRLTPVEIEQLGHGGIDVSLDDIRVLDDGTLAYKDSRILVYARDVSLASSAADMIWNVPRFHFADCRKIRDARQKNRWAPYVAAIKEDGNFAVNKVHMWGKAQADLLRLAVCENCLDALAFEGFSHEMDEESRRGIVASFSIRRFFKKYPKCLVIEEAAREAEAGAGAAPLHDHSEFVARMKRERGYRCDACELTLAVPGQHKFLHVTYKDEDRRKANPKDVKVLCLRCHAESPRHAHLKSTLEYREFARRFGAAPAARDIVPPAALRAKRPVLSATRS